MWYTEVMLWILRILTATFVLFIMFMTVAVICVTLCAGRNRDWEEDDRAQMEAMKKLRERDKTRN